MPKFFNFSVQIVLRDKELLYDQQQPVKISELISKKTNMTLRLKKQRQELRVENLDLLK